MSETKPVASSVATENKTEQPQAEENKNQQESSQSNEASLRGQKQDGNVVKKEGEETKPSYFDAEIEQLKKLSDHQKEVIAHKNRAIDSLKERSRKAEKKLETFSFDDTSNVEEGTSNKRDEVLEQLENLRREQEDLRQALLSKTADDEVIRLTSDPGERQAMRLALDAYKINSGNRELDARAAQAIVNARRFFEEGKKAGYSESKEDFMTHYSASGTSASKAEPEKTPNPMAAELLRKIGRADAIKYL